VLANFKTYSGALEFFNVDMMETMGEGEHTAATQLTWDPAGRFVATFVRAPQVCAYLQAIRPHAPGVGGSVVLI
jgi:hypothetical protein